MMSNKQSSNTLRRRDFVKYAALAMSGTGIACLPHKSRISEVHEQPLFSFVQLNDTHLKAPRRPGGYAKANEKLKHVVDTINEEKHFPLPDFVIVVGDIIHGAAMEYLEPECEMARGMLSALRCPYYTVLGNHENIQREGDPIYEEAYEKVFGKGKSNYCFAYKGFLFVCLNNTNGLGNDNRNEVTRRRNQWLRGVLNKYPAMPKIIACHIPMVCLRDELVLKESFGFATYKMIGSGTWDIIRAEKETVVAVMSGHLHLTGAVKEQGIYHICSAGTASYPCHYAHYTVFRDRIDVQMHQIANDLVTPATNIHGKPRYEQGFTDSRHKTPDEYVCGTKAEQRFMIPLSSGSP